MLRVVAHLLLVLTLALSAARSEQPPQGRSVALCYATLNVVFPQSQILLDCNGQQQRIPTGGNIEDFAVDQEGSTLALVRGRWKKTGRSSWLGISDLGVVDLRGTGALQVSALPEYTGVGVMASCGTIEMLEGAQGSKARDLIRGSKLTMKPFWKFRCSSDRATVAGVRKRTSGELVVRSNSQQTVIRRDDDWAFDLSPNGKYLAYMVSYRRLCVAELKGVTSCTNLRSGALGVSVSDEGEVIIKRESTELGYWRAGQESETRVRLPGLEAQWLNRRAAAALVSWSAAHGKPQWPTNRSTPEFILTPETAPNLLWAPPY